MSRISAFLAKTIAVAFVFCSVVHFSAQAQFVTKQVIIASGGTFGNPNNYVRVGSFNPETKVYTVFDSIHASSTKSAIIYGANAYVTADTVLIKYDIDKYKRLAVSPSTTGLSYLETYKNYVLATRGYGASSDFVKVYNQADLSEAFTITGISNQAAGIVVAGDTAYVAVPGSYNKDSGSIAVIDLTTMQLKREIALDTMGAQIGKIYTDGINVYTVNSKRSVISTYNIATGKLTHHIFYTSQYGSGNGVGLSRDVLYTDFGYKGIGAYSVFADTVSKSLSVDYNKIPGFNTFSVSVSGAAYDENNEEFYVTVTDYFSMGAAYVFDKSGNITDTFAVGISPEAIAVDTRFVESIKNNSHTSFQLIAYPNPAKNALHLSAPDIANATITITDISGKVLMQQKASNSVDINGLPAGIYMLKLTSANTTGITKFIKE